MNISHLTFVCTTPPFLIAEKFCGKEDRLEIMCCYVINSTSDHSVTIYSSPLPLQPAFSSYPLTIAALKSTYFWNYVIAIDEKLGEEATLTSTKTREMTKSRKATMKLQNHGWWRRGRRYLYIVYIFFLRLLYYLW